MTDQSRPRPKIVGARPIPIRPRPRVQKTVVNDPKFVAPDVRKTPDAPNPAAHWVLLLGVILVYLVAILIVANGITWWINMTALVLLSISATIGLVFYNRNKKEVYRVGNHAAK